MIHDKAPWARSCNLCGRFGTALPRLRQRISRITLPLAFLGSLASATLAADTNATPQILFLHLKVKNQAVSLVDSVARPGVLKARPAAASESLHFELFSATGESVWKASVPDPAVRHVEHEDPPGSGNLISKTVVLDETEFTVRVPAMSNARRIDFYKLEPSATNATAATTFNRKSLGSVALP